MREDFNRPGEIQCVDALLDVEDDFGWSRHFVLVMNFLPLG